MTATVAETPAPAKKTPANKGIPNARKGMPSMSLEGLVLAAFKSKTIAELEEKISKYAPSRGLMRRALKKAAEDDLDVSSLRDLLAEKGGLAGVRGRAAPVVGEKRVYGVQALKDQPSCFIRLPLNTLGCVKGDKVIVTFREDRTVVRKKGAQVAEAGELEATIEEDAPEAAPEAAIAA